MNLQLTTRGTEPVQFTPTYEREPLEKAVTVMHAAAAGLTLVAAAVMPLPVFAGGLAGCLCVGLGCYLAACHLTAEHDEAREEMDRDEGECSGCYDEGA